MLWDGNQIQGCIILLYLRSVKPFQFCKWQGLLHTLVSGSNCGWVEKNKTTTVFQVFFSLRSHVKWSVSISVYLNVLWEIWKDKGCCFSLYSAWFCQRGSNRKLSVYWKGVFSHPACCVRTVTISCAVREGNMHHCYHSTSAVLGTHPPRVLGAPVCHLIGNLFAMHVPWDTSMSVFQLQVGQFV